MPPNCYRCPEYYHILQYRMRKPDRFIQDSLGGLFGGRYGENQIERAQVAGHCNLKLLPTKQLTGCEERNSRICRNR